MIGARWAARQRMNSLCRDGFPDDSFKDHPPYWGEYKNRTRGGTNYKHQREKEVRLQKAGERLRLMTGMVRPALPCGGVPLSAALTYEDAIESRKASKVTY